MGSWLVLYDGECRFCQWVLALLLCWDRDGKLCPVALQSPRAERLLADLSEAARLESWHLLAPSGERSSAGAALPVVLELLPGGLVPARVLRLVPRQTELTYRWVAEHRVRLSRLLPSSWKRWGSDRVLERERIVRGDF